MTDQLKDRASQLMKAGSWADAVRLLEQVLPTARTHEQNWNHGWALFQLKQPELALASLRRALLQEPVSAPTNFALGIVLDELGKLEEAEQRLLATLRVKDLTIARLSLALIYMKQGRLPEAERVHVEGLELRPGHLERVEAYADFLSDCGREDDARIQYAKAAELKSR